ncbi:AAA family ATPase [Lachnospiraceae bacterium JLR.KK008]
MTIKEIRIRNFKSLYDVSFQPGKVNVLIGANGSGKSTILEAIGVLSAAMTDRVNSSSLQKKGIRLSTSALYKSKFKSMNRDGLTVSLDIDWEDEDEYKYSVHLTTPTDDDTWKYHSENISENGNSLWGRSNRSYAPLNNHIGYYMLTEELDGSRCRKMGQYIEKYGIYQPDTQTLRGTVMDPAQTAPVGLHGGRIAEALQEMMKNVDGDMKFGTLYMEEILDLIDWASGFSITTPKKINLNRGVPSMRQVIEFKDRFLKTNAVFTGYDASEGALYVLFMLCMAMHPESPSMFAIDSFDHALNPRLAQKIAELFCQLIQESGRTVFMTTHNPLVLDGLDLCNDDIRLFAVSRDQNGYAVIDRIQVSNELLESGQSLSRLWINGRLGGVPELI